MQTLKLDINPKGEIPVLYVSQYDKGREFGIELVEGEDNYNVPSGYSVQLNVRKTDSKLVTAAPKTIVDNTLTFVTTEQMTACAGENIASVSLIDADDFIITTLYFLISVQRDVLAGGLDSASEIHNLEQQIAAIVPEVIGDDYYNKSETDALLHDKVDASVLNANYYTKWATDGMLANKADKSELPDMNNYYDKTYIDNRFSIYRSWASTELYLDNHYYTKSQVDVLIDNIFPTLSVSGAIANFKTALNKTLVSVTHEAGATTITRCGVNLFNELWEKGTINQATGEEEPNAYISRSGFISIAPNTRYYYGYTSQNNVRGFYYDSNMNYLGTFIAYSNNSFVSNANARYLRIIIGDADGIPGTTINYPSSDTDYHAYEGQTVPVADATTLTTLSGVNNVFADSGDVTVQYKYMSI